MNDSTSPHLADHGLGEPGDSPPDALFIPVIAEQLHVDKQVVETGRVRLTKTIHSEEQIIQIPLQNEAFLVERVSLNQYVDQPPAIRQEGEATIYPVLKEVVVVEKRLLLIEEIRVTKNLTETIQQQTVLLRQEVVDVERMDGSSERSAPGGPSL